MRHEEIEKYLLTLFNPTQVSEIRVTDFSTEAVPMRGLPTETKIGFLAMLTNGGHVAITLKTTSVAINAMLRADVVFEKVQKKKRDKDSQVDFNEELKKI